MTDPAIEATQRAIGKVQRSEPYRWAESGAREALAPLRELHRPFSRPASCYSRSNMITCYSRSNMITVCNHCLGPRDWPCPTARLIYSTEELS